MYESSNEEGGALNSFGNNLGFDGKEINLKNKYQIYGTSINQLIDDEILKVPNYIKIDVDGNEHLILEKATSILTSNKVKEIMVEVNEDYREQFIKVNSILQENSFTFKQKFISEFAKNSKFQKSYNCLFKKTI